MIQIIGEHLDFLNVFFKLTHTICIYGVQDNILIHICNA